MRKLALLPFLALAFACNDSTLVQPDEAFAPEVAATRAAPQMVPLKGDGPWTWDGVFRAPSSECSAAGGTVEFHYTVHLNLTHFGRSSSLAEQCIDLAAWATVFTVETITAANGDQLFLYEGSTQLSELPPGWDIGYAFVVTGGTGRFEDASGDGEFYATSEGVFPDLHGKAMYVGVVSAVGTSL